MRANKLTTLCNVLLTFIVFVPKGAVAAVPRQLPDADNAPDIESASTSMANNKASRGHRPDHGGNPYSTNIKYGLCVEDVPSNFRQVREKGTKLGIWTGGKKSIFPWVGKDLQKLNLNSHIQSLQRIRTLDGRNNYFVFPASSQITGGGAVLLVGKIESSKRVKDRRKENINPTPIQEGNNGPIVSNKFYKKRKWRFDKRWFQKRDKIVAVVKVGRDVLQAHDPPRLYTHPGGITAMDDINVVAVGIDLLPKKAATSRVVFYDFENPEKPKYLENSGIHRTAPADKKRGNPAPTVAITSLPSNGKRYYLLAIGNLFKSPNPILPKRSGDEIQFYKSREFDPSKGRADNPILQGNPEWTELPDFERKIADIEMSPRILNNIKRLQNKRCKKNGRVTKEECERKIALKQKSILNFQTLNFVRQCDGSLFLVGFGNKNNAFKGALKLIGKGGEDQAQLLKVDPEKMTVTLERTRRFKCDDACNFDGGAGLYLAEDRKNKGTARMIFYGSEHWPSAPGKWGKTKDFAPTHANIQNKVIRMNEFAPSPIDDDKS
jgi:hypothetical protein